MTGSTPDAPRLQPFTVGDWLVDPRACQVSRGETVVKLRPQLVDVLLCLAGRAGEIVLKEEILAQVWPGQYIAESGLSRCVAELRHVLQDDAQAPRFIETIPKRGYRLVAPVAWPALLQEEVGGAPVAGGAPAPDRGAREAPAEPSGEGAGSAADAAGTRAPRSPRHMRWAVVALVLLVGAAAATALVIRGRSETVLTERDPVLLAFENRTGDKVFDEVIPFAMSIQLEQSPHLALLSPGRVAEVLQMMRRPSDTPITRSVGLEACERAGARAVIVTSIASLGRQYAVGLEAVACGTGEVLARRQVITDGKEHLLDGLHRAGGEIRAAVGEPAASLARYNVPIVEATTASLEALRALRRGDMARDRGETGPALEFYRTAVSLDPEFALAHSRRGRTAQQRGTEAEAREAFERAFALRERVTLPERLEIEATYHRFVAGNMAKNLEALTRLRENYPRRAWIRHFLSFVHLEEGRLEASLAEALEAQRLEPDSPRILIGVARLYLCLGRIPEARATADKGVALGGGNNAPLRLVLLECGLAQNDTGLVARERAWAAEHPEASEPHVSEVLADVALGRGRFQDAMALMERVEGLANSAGRPTLAGTARLRMACFEGLAGHRARAVRRVEGELRRGVPPQVMVEALRAAGAAGDLPLTERLVQEVERLRAPGVQPDTTLARTYRAVLAAHQGRVEQARADLAALEPLDLGFLYEFLPLFERGRVNDLAGDWPAARAAFEKMLAHPHAGPVQKLLPLGALGLARTLAKAGDVTGSRRAYEQLFERWRDADPDLPVLLEARREYASLPR